MTRLKTEEVEEPILDILRKKGPQTTKQIAAELSRVLGYEVRAEALFVILDRIKKKGLIVGVPNDLVPQLADEWWKWGREKAWLLREDAEKLGLI